MLELLLHAYFPSALGSSGLGTPAIPAACGIFDFPDQLIIVVISKLVLLLF